MRIRSAGRLAGVLTSAARSVSAAMHPPVEAPERSHTEEVDDVVEPVSVWKVVVWNDPVNLMSYVVWVFRKLFGHSLEKATRLMLDVHHKGRAVVSSGPREKAEMDAYRLHHHGLWATLERE